MPKGKYTRKLKKIKRKPKEIVIIDDEPEEVVVPVVLPDNNYIKMQINFSNQSEKDQAITDQTALNVSDEANAKAVYDKRVKRGVDQLNDLNNATVGAVVPASSIAVSVVTEIVNRISSIPTEAQQIIAEINQRAAR